MKFFFRFIRNKHSGLKKIYRSYYWGVLFGSFGSKSRVLGPITVLNPEKIFVGENCSINPYCFLNAKSQIVIGDHVHVSPQAMIHTGGLIYTENMQSRNHFSKPVIIENGVWIGSGAIITPGVRIGSDSVIGAGAVVTKDIPPRCVAVGVPARVIKSHADSEVLYD